MELSAAKLPPEPPGSLPGTTEWSRRIPVSFVGSVLDALPDTCLHAAVGRVAAATPLPQLEQPGHPMDLFDPEHGPSHETEPSRPAFPGPCILESRQGASRSGHRNHPPFR